jgi:hypothetical protein
MMLFYSAPAVHLSALMLHRFGMEVLNFDIG